MARRLSAMALIPAGIAVAVSRMPEFLMLSAFAILTLIVILGILAIVTAVLFTRSGEPASRLDQLMRTVRGSPSKRHAQAIRATSHPEQNNKNSEGTADRQPRE